MTASRLTAPLALAAAGLALAAPGAHAAQRVSVKQARAITRVTVELASASLPTAHSVRVEACRRRGAGVACAFTLALSGDAAEECDSALTVDRRGRRLRLRLAPLQCRVPIAQPAPAPEPTGTPAPQQPSTPTGTVVVAPPPLELGGTVVGGTTVELAPPPTA